MLSVLTPGKKKKKVEKERKKQGLPGGPVGQYLPADAGDTGSLSGLESSHVLLGTASSDSEARVPGAPAP